MVERLLAEPSYYSLVRNYFLELYKAAVTTIFQNYTKPPVKSCKFRRWLHLMDVYAQSACTQENDESSWIIPMIPMAKSLDGKTCRCSERWYERNLYQMMSVGNKEVFKLETMKPFYIYDTLVEINNKYKQKSGLIRCNSFKIHIVLKTTPLIILDTLSYSG